MNRKLNLSWLMWLSSLLLLPHPVVPSNSRSLPALCLGRFIVSHTPSRFLPESLSLETWAQRFWPTKGPAVVLGLCRRSQTRARIAQPSVSQLWFMCKSQALLLQMVPIFVRVIKGLQHNRITYCRDVSGSKVNIFCMEYSFLALVEGRRVQLEAAARDVLSFKTGKKIMPSRASQHVVPRGRGEAVGRPNEEQGAG